MDPKNASDETALTLVVDGQLAQVVEVDEPGITREQRRSRRKREVRARTISVKRMTKRELELGASSIRRSTSSARPPAKTAATV